MFENSPVLRWRKYNEKYLLEGNKCLECKKIHYPKVYLCKCGSQKFEPINLSGKGTLLTFTQITTPPKAFKEYAPYCIGIIQLSEGPKILSQITDVELKDLKIGMNVQTCFRKIYTAGEKDTINYGLKFVTI